MINKIKISEIKSLTINLLPQEVDLNDSFTLKHIFSLIYSNPDIETFFKAYFNISYLDDLKDELLSQVIPENGPKDEFDKFAEEPEVIFEKILIRKNVYISKANKYPGYFNEYIDLIGVNQNKENKDTYALDFMELNRIADTPIFFSKKMNFERNGFDPQKYFEFLDLEDTEYDLTLLNLINSIIWELTFYGSPAARNKQKEELNLRIKEIDSGLVKTYSMKEFFEKFNLEKE